MSDTLTAASAAADHPDRAAAASFIWYELMTSETEAAATFYRDVVGWETRSFEGSADGYTILEAGGRGVGGVMKIPADARAGGARPCWLGYIAVADVDVEAQAVVAAGGTLHRDIMDIPTVGRMAMVSDPQGAPFYLIAPEGSGDGPVPFAAPGGVGWHELHTSDWEAAFAFYSDHYGWEKSQAMDMGPMGTYQLVSAGGRDIGAMYNDGSLGRPAWLFYFVVGDIDDAAGRVRASGGDVLNGPMEVPGGAFVINCRDPQGAMFALVGSRG